MRALLPFAWNRLAAQDRQALGAGRAQFLIAPLMTCVPMGLGEPALPDYMLFTSMNGIRSVVGQAWFGADWTGIPVAVIGPKTAGLAQSLGLNVQIQAPPPAQTILTKLPKGKGLWFSGAEVAVDLVTSDVATSGLAMSGLAAEQGGADLERVIAYTLQRDEAQAQRIAAALSNGSLSAALITSDRILRELHALAHAAQAKLDKFAVLSARLKGGVQKLFPGAEIEEVATLETGVRWLLKGHSK